MKESDISVIDLNGNSKNNIKPSSEVKIHLAIYNNKKTAGAIVHCHSHWASVLSCLRKKIPAFHYMVAELGGTEIKCAEYATFGTKQLAENVVRSLRDTKGCLISNHGQICFGQDLSEAIHLSYAIEKLSKQYYFCFISRKTKLLDNEEIKKVLNKFKSYKAKH